VVSDLGLDLLGELELLFLDQLVHELREVVNREGGVGEVPAVVGGGGLVAASAGGDHCLGPPLLDGPDVVLRELGGEAGLPGPQHGGGAAILLSSQNVQLNSGTVQNGGPGLGDPLHPVGPGAACIEDDVGMFGARDIRRPPVTALLPRLVVGIAEVLDALGELGMRRQGPLTLADHPLPYLLPEFRELDIDVAYGLALGAAGAAEQSVHELLVDLHLASQQSVHRGALHQLCQVEYLAPGSNRLPWGLLVSGADSHAITALQTSKKFPIDIRHLYHGYSSKN